MKSIVVAYDKARAIGKGGELPWAGALPADMQHFRDVTMGGSVIMGRKTFDSLPERFRPLPGRQNIILSLGEVAGTGFQVARSIEEAYALAETEDVHVIGGGQIYSAAMPFTEIIYATEIDTLVDHPDTYFPTIPVDDWHLESREDFLADGRNRFRHSFVTYLRNNPIDNSFSE